MIPELMSILTGVTVIYAGDTGKGWEAFYAWLGEMALVISVYSLDQAQTAKVMAQQALEKR